MLLGGLGEEKRIAERGVEYEIPILLHVPLLLSSTSVQLASSFPLVLD